MNTKIFHAFELLGAKGLIKTYSRFGKKWTFVFGEYKYTIKTATDLGELQYAGGFLIFESLYVKGETIIFQADGKSVFVLNKDGIGIVSPEVVS